MIAGLASPSSTDKIKAHLKNVVLVAPLTLMTPPTTLNSITSWIMNQLDFINSWTCPYGGDSFLFPAETVRNLIWATC
jgi:hypothetical protein